MKRNVILTKNELIKVINESVINFINEKYENFISKLNKDKFIRWFGDWKNDPENSSKVVDSNGNPKVVYHGTTSFGEDGKPFTKFKFQKDGKNGGTNSPGFFTDSISVAGFFAGSDDIKFFYKDLWDAYKSENPSTVEDCLEFLSQYTERYADMEITHEDDKIFVNGYDPFEGKPYRFSMPDDDESIVDSLRKSIELQCKLYSRNRYSKHSHSAGVVYPCYLSIKNPFTVDADGKRFYDLPWEDFYDKAVSSGCDGIIVYNVLETTLGYSKCTDYIPFKTSQIKHSSECVDFSDDDDIFL